MQNIYDQAFLSTIWCVLVAEWLYYIISTAISAVYLPVPQLCPYLLPLPPLRLTRANDAELRKEMIALRAHNAAIEERILAFEAELAGIPWPYVGRYHTSNIQRYKTPIWSVCETPVYQSLETIIQSRFQIPIYGSKKTHMRFTKSNRSRFQTPI